MDLTRCGVAAWHGGWCAQLQLVAVFAAKLGTAEIATHTALMNFFQFLSSIMFALVDSTSIRVGCAAVCVSARARQGRSASHRRVGGGGFRYHLGGGRVPEAKRVGKIMLVASSILGTCPSTAHTAQPCALPSEVVTRGACPTSGLLGSVMFFVMGSNVGRMFSSDAEVVALSGKLAFLEGLVYMGACWDRTLLPAFPHGVGSHVCICYACATALCFFYTSIAILGGQGRPTFVAAAFVIGGWGVSVPMAWVLGFPAGLVRARVYSVPKLAHSPGTHSLRALGTHRYASRGCKASGMAS